MLSLVFSLVFASVSAQNATISSSTPQTTLVPNPNPGNSTLPSLPPACQAKLSQNTGLASCGSAISNMVTSGTLPSIPTDAQAKTLDAFCSSSCSAAISTLATDLSSAECADGINTLLPLKVSPGDISTVLNTLTQFACAKDGSTYCAISLANDPALSGTPTNATLQNQTLICGKCLRLEADIVNKGLQSLSANVQAELAPQFKSFTQLTDAQKQCPANNSALKAAAIPLVAFVLGLAMF